MNQRPKKKTTDKGRHSQVKTVRNGSAREDVRSRLERRSPVRATADVSSKRSRHARVHPIHGFSSFEDEHHSPAYGTYASASANRKNGAISPSRARKRAFKRNEPCRQNGGGVSPCIRWISWHAGEFSSAIEKDGRRCECVSKADSKV